NGRVAAVSVRVLAEKQRRPNEVADRDDDVQATTEASVADEFHHLPTERPLVVEPVGGRVLELFVERVEVEPDGREVSHDLAEQVLKILPVIMFQLVCQAAAVGRL